MRARRDRAVQAVVLEAFLNRLGFGIVTFALPLYALQLGLSLTEIGLIVAAKALVQPLVKPPMGWVIDRFGARRGYQLATALRFASSLLLLVATTPLGLVLVRVVQGAASAATEPASVTVVARGEQSWLGRRFSAVYGARDVGKVSAGLVGGLVLGATGSFTVLWTLVAVTAAIPVWVVWKGLHEDPDAPAEAPAHEPGPDAESAGRILRNPRLRLIAALGLMTGMTAHMTSALFQVYAVEVAGLGPAQIGLIYSASIVALLAVGPAAGWAGDRFGVGSLASARAVANAGSSLVYLFFPVFAGLLGGRLIDDAGKAAFRPTWGALLASASRSAGPRSGRVVANLDAARSVGEALGPIVAGLIWDLSGAVAFLLARAALGVAAELVFGQRLRSALRADAAARDRPLIPGPGRLELRNVTTHDLHGSLSGVVEPRQVAALDASAAAATLLRELVTGRGAPNGGTLLLDGEDLGTRSAAALRGSVAVLELDPPPTDARVGDWLAGERQEAPPEELARVWTLAGLAEIGPLERWLELEVGRLGLVDRVRVALAASLVGDPALLVLDDALARPIPELDPTIDAVLADHAGAALVLNPRPERLARADVVLRIEAREADRHTTPAVGRVRRSALTRRGAARTP